jgi:murein DD-endopeptidase MepM/ murein hydrolase activator NlpD
MDGSSIGNLAPLSLRNALAGKIAATAERAGSKDLDERQKVAQEFASFLINEVLKAMRAALPQDGFVENESMPRDIYTTMMDAEISRALAKRDSTGLTKMVQDSLDRIAPEAPKKIGIQSPVPGMVSSEFGMRTDPLTFKTKFHHGVDIAAPLGTTVKAAAGGKVLFSGWVAGYGNLVEIDHGGGVSTRYAHNSVNLISVGDQVQPGQRIALVGSAGRSTGAHVHFEVRSAGRSVNPADLAVELPKGTRLNSII